MTTRGEAIENERDDPSLAITAAAASVARDHHVPFAAVVEDQPAVLGESAAPAVAEEPARGGMLVTLCFAGATFLGAFLLFLVQPLIAKYILPWFGGGATVWTTCVLFFQATLLGGYLYAHLGASRLATRPQAWVHAVLLLAAAAAALPAIVPGERWKAGAAVENPTGQILLLLLATVGLPCLALAATSPLLHSWYSRIRPGAAVYRLYALSNVGSLLALLAYPLVFEPLLSRRAQATIWSASMAAFALLCAACAALASRYAGDATPDATPADGEGLDRDGAPRRDDPASAAAGPLRTLLWLALPACASALLLATTNTMTQDLAPIPFLWVLPLAVYLLTFIVAFDHPRWYVRRAFNVLLIVGCAAAVWVFSDDEGELSAMAGVAVLASVLFAGCMVLHGELARLRPPAAQLTRYYLAIAAGGAAGGLLVAVGAPLLLKSYAEFNIALCACCVLAWAVPLVAERRAPGALSGFVVPVAVLSLGGLLWTLSSGYLRAGNVLERGRDFYGVLSVVEVGTLSGQVRRLYHGSINHGQQLTRPDRRALPTTYFRPASGYGRLLGSASPLRQPRRVAVVGLGIGTIAAYAQAGDVYRFYEISPNVERLARTWFTYLADAETRGATVGVVIGDGRLSLEREAPGAYDVIALDAFSGDGVPVHLLTREAFDLYTRHLAPGGVVAVQITNRYLDLRPVVIAAARERGWHHVTVETEATRDELGFYSRQILLSPDPAPIEFINDRQGAGPEPDVRNVQPWTDEHANLLAALQ